MIRQARPLALLFVVLFMLVACGSTAREKTIHAALVSTKAAHAGFKAFDDRHQAEIIATTPNAVDVPAALAAWRVRRDKVSAIFIDVYEAIAVTAALDDQASLVNLTRLGALLLDMLQDISGGKLP